MSSDPPPLERMSEPIELLVAAAARRLRPFASELRTAGWDASLYVVAPPEDALAVEVRVRIRLDRTPLPIEVPLKTEDEHA